MKYRKLAKPSERLLSVSAGQATFSLLCMTKVPAFSPSPLRLMYVQVAEHIAARIEAGELKPGHRLPPEREMASEYGVAYNTMRKSMEILRERGLIVTMHGRGTFVNDPLPPRTG